MDTLFLWVKNIVSFLLILTLVFELLPTKDYGKYVRVSAGMILLIVVMGPLTRLFGVEDNLDFYLSWEKLKSQMGATSLAEDILNRADLEEQRMGAIIDEYKKTLEQQIRQVLNLNGLKAGEILLSVHSDETKENFGQILSMEIYDLENVQATELQNEEDEIVAKVEIQPVTIGEKKKETPKPDSEIIIGLKKQLAEKFCMDINRIFIVGG